MENGYCLNYQMHENLRLEFLKSRFFLCGVCYFDSGVPVGGGQEGDVAPLPDHLVQGDLQGVLLRG